MPYKSEKQRRYLKANKPEVAKKFDAHEKKRRGKTKLPGLGTNTSTTPRNGNR